MKSSFLDALSMIRNYPNQFYDYSEGLDLDNQEIKSMFEDCLKSLMESEDETFTYCATGNTIVIILKLGPDNHGIYDYEFIVCKNYQSANLSSLDNMHKYINDAKKFFS